MRYVFFALLTHTYLFAKAAVGGGIHPSCKLAKKSVISRTSAGVAQVSNLGGLEIRCLVPARPFPSKPGETRNGLRANTNAYEISASGEKNLVPSEVKVFAGGSESETEWVEFDMLIPLDPKELDIETRRYYAKALAALTAEQRAQMKAVDEQKALENLRLIIAQSRTGRFKLECQVLDGDGGRVLGSDVIEIEIVYKGRFSDAGLVSVPVA